MIFFFFELLALFKYSNISFLEETVRSLHLMVSGSVSALLRFSVNRLPLASPFWWWLLSLTLSQLLVLKSGVLGEWTFFLIENETFCELKKESWVKCDMKWSNNIFPDYGNRGCKNFTGYLVCLLSAFWRVFPSISIFPVESKVCLFSAFWRVFLLISTFPVK